MPSFDARHNRLVYTGSPATATYWATLWENKRNLKDALASASSDPLIANLTRRFLGAPAGQRVLDGGCGIGQHVARLQKIGYEAYGVDNDPLTVARVKEVAPQLHIIQGDVRALPWPPNFFDGYWSIGVIEHWSEGYGSCAQEMHRVLKPGGYLFLTFPHMSSLRKIKARLGLYPLASPNLDSRNFYQFALNAHTVREDFKKLGFQLRYQTSTAGFKGFKDESGPLKPILQQLYDNKLLLAKVIKIALSWILNPFSGHSAVLVFQKKKV